MKKYLALLLTLCVMLAALGCGSKDKNEGKAALQNYLTALISGKYDEAYELLCNQDKKNTSKEVFYEWFRNVAKVQQVKSFKVSNKADSFKNMVVYEDKYSRALGFEVTSELQKNINGVTIEPYGEEKYKIMAVYEEDKWKIFAGYKDLKSKTEKLAQAAAGK